MKPTSVVMNVPPGFNECLHRLNDCMPTASNTTS